MNFQKFKDDDALHLKIKNTVSNCKQTTYKTHDLARGRQLVFEIFE